MFEGQYVEIPMYSVDEVYKILNSKTSPKLSKVHAIISLGWHGKDYYQAQEICKKYISNSDRELKLAAIESVGHIARVFGKIDPIFIKILNSFLKDKDKEVVGVAEDTLSDIEIFIKDFSKK